MSKKRLRSRKRENLAQAFFAFSPLFCSTASASTTAMVQVFEGPAASLRACAPGSYRTMSPAIISKEDEEVLQVRDRKSSSVHLSSSAAHQHRVFTLSDLSRMRDPAIPPGCEQCARMISYRWLLKEVLKIERQEQFQLLLAGKAGPFRARQQAALLDSLEACTSLHSHGPPARSGTPLEPQSMGIASPTPQHMSAQRRGSASGPVGVGAAPRVEFLIM